MMSSVAVDPELYMDTAFGALYTLAVALMVINEAVADIVDPLNILDQQVGREGRVVASKFSVIEVTETQAVAKLGAPIHELFGVPQILLM